MTNKEQMIQQSLEKSVKLYSSDKQFNPSTTQPEQLKETIDLFFAIVKTVRSILKNRPDIHFRVVDAELSPKIQATPLGTMLYEIIHNPLLTKINEYFTYKKDSSFSVERHPYIDLFFACLTDDQHKILIKADATTKVNLLNEFIISLRQKAKDSNEELVKTIKRRKNTFNQNYTQLTHYIKKLLSHYGELRIIQFELSYQPNHYLSVNPVIDYAQVKKHREQFLISIRSASHSNFAHYLIGFAWKLKYTVFKGFYYELLLLFHMPENISIEQEIANCWLAQTDQKGRYQYKSIYYISKTNKHFDNSKLSPELKEQKQKQQKDNNLFIQKAITSLTQIDLYLHYAAPNKDHTFNKGQLRTVKTKQQLQKKAAQKFSTLP